MRYQIFSCREVNKLNILDKVVYSYLQIDHTFLLQKAGVTSDF